MVNKYIAYCGLYCKDCLRYNSDLINNAEDLKDEIIERHFQEYVNIKKASDNGFSKYPDFIDVLDKIIGLKCEKPCREGNGCSTLECKILSCCKTKGFEGCWECKSFESCSNFDFLKPFHGTTPQDNLRLIRDKGVRSIEASRHKFYMGRIEPNRARIRDERENNSTHITCLLPQYV